MRLELLGPLRIWSRDEEVVLGPPKQRAALGVLASRVNHVVSLERMVDAVWGDAAPQTAVNGIHTYVAGLRRALEPDRGPRESGGVLVSAGGGYALCMDPEAVDAERFTRQHTEARRLRADGHPERAGQVYEAALALWHGEAYANVPGPFADLERTRLRELRLTAIEEWADTMLAVARHTETVAVLSDLVTREPLRERLRWLLMLALYRCGRRAHALGLYRETRQLLHDELGLEPGFELRRLHEQILGGHPDLDPRRPPSEGAASLSGGTLTGNTLSGSSLTGSALTGPRRDGHAVPALAPAPRPAQLPPDARGFTGRGEELARLRNFVTQEHARPGTPAALAVVEGGAGVGKTALALRLAHRLSEDYPDGQLFVDLRGTSPEQQPLSARAALAQVLRSLGVPDARMPDDLTGRTSLYRSLLHGRRVLLVLDDALDAEQVRPLLPRGPAGVLITSRRRQYGLAARDGAYRIGLAPLPQDDALELLTYLIGEPRLTGRQDSAVRLAQLCGCLPLALRIAAEGMVAKPRLSLDELVDDHAAEHNRLDRFAVEGDVAASLRIAFAASLRLLPADAAHLFRLLGLYAGTRVTVPVAAVLSGKSPAWAARQLEVLADHHLLEDVGRDSYRLHSLIRLYAAECADEEPLEDRTAALARMLPAEPLDGAISEMQPPESSCRLSPVGHLFE